MLFWQQILCCKQEKEVPCLADKDSVFLFTFVSAVFERAAPTASGLNTQLFSPWKDISLTLGVVVFPVISLLCCIECVILFTEILDMTFSWITSGNTWRCCHVTFHPVVRARHPLLRIDRLTYGHTSHSPKVTFSQPFAGRLVYLWLMNGAQVLNLRRYNTLCWQKDRAVAVDTLGAFLFFWRVSCWRTPKLEDLYFLSHN